MKKIYIAALAVSLVGMFLSGVTTHSAGNPTIMFKIGPANSAPGCGNVWGSESTVVSPATQANGIITHYGTGNSQPYAECMRTYLNDSVFAVDFRIGARMCEAGGVNCIQGYTGWASDIALGKGGPWSPMIDANGATPHNRFNETTALLDTRPLPAGIDHVTAKAGIFLQEWDFGAPGGQITAVAKSLYQFTPDGGGYSPFAWATWGAGTNVPSPTPDLFGLYLDATSPGFPKLNLSKFQTVMNSKDGASDVFGVLNQGNPGAVDLQWQVLPSSTGPIPSWLSIAPMTGLTAQGGQTPVQLSFSPTATGTYTYDFLVNCLNCGQTASAKQQNGGLAAVINPLDGGGGNVPPIINGGGGGGGGGNPPPAVPTQFDYAVSYTVDTPPPPPVTSTLVIDPPFAQAAVGAQAVFRALNGAQATDVSATATWTSSDPTVAKSLGGGTFSALAPGTITVSATYQGSTAQASLTILSGPQQASLIITPQSQSASPGDSAVYSASYTDAAGVSRDVTGEGVWSVGSNSIAQLVGPGQFRALAVGTTQVKIVAQGLSASATLNVVPVNTPDFTLSLSPTATTTVKNAAVKVNVMITPVGAPAGSVDLSVDAASAGLFKPSFAPASLASGTSVLTLHTGGNPFGTYNIVVSGTRGATFKSQLFTLTIASSTGGIQEL